MSISANQVDGTVLTARLSGESSMSYNPLIVTGNFPSSWVSQPQGAYTALSNGTNLSHTIEEIVEAFQAGREVKIILNAINPGTYEFGNWKMRYAELRVFEASVVTTGYYKLHAHGMAYAQDNNGKAEATPIQIICNGSTPMISTPIKA